jgi:hypothetical protein
MMKENQKEYAGCSVYFDFDPVNGY